MVGNRAPGRWKTCRFLNFLHGIDMIHDYPWRILATCFLFEENWLNSPRLEKKVGKNNGSVRGEIYFEQRSQHFFDAACRCKVL